MNILYLTNQLNYTDGVSTHLFYLLKHLKKMRDVNVFLMYGEGDASDKFNNENINLKQERKLNHRIRSISNYSSAIYTVYGFCRQNKINIIHSHNHYSSSIAKHASVFLNVKTVQTNHGIIPGEGRLNHFNADFYIAVNDRIKKFIVDNNIAGKSNVRLIYNGIDFDDTLIIKKNSPLKIIAASRFEKSKGLNTFILAVSKLPESLRKNVEIIIAGEGSLEKELKESDKKLKTGIIFSGNDKDLRKKLDQTSIFVIASNTEGLPMTIIEAAASRNLIVSSDFAGVTDILKNGTDGLIFKRNDADDLASKLIFALTNKELTDKMTSVFYEKAKKNFNSGLMCSEHINFYREILK